MGRVAQIQIAACLMVCAVIITVPALLGARHADWFTPYFGTVPAPAAALCAAIVGAAALAVLHRRFGFLLIDRLIAQLVLHVAPFLLILLLLERVWQAPRRSTRIRVAIGLAALLEAGFQIQGGRAADAVLAGFVLLQLFAFGVVELTLFRRYDYLAMITFRLTYYTWWHIVWGYLRIL